MNFQQLEYVLAVHKYKHFGTAAFNCNITQATLSAMIIKLEKELDIVLFDRSRKPVKTTDVGEEFMEKARAILEKKDELYTLCQMNDLVAGKLSVGIIPTIASSLLPLILPAILANNPKLELSITEITTEQIKQQLILDKIDLGILATPLNDDQFKEHILYYEPLMVYGIQDSDKNYVTTEDVKDNKVWLLEEGHCFRNQTLNICAIKEKEMQQSNLNFNGNSFETLLNLADKFGGYTLIPELYYYEMNALRQAKTKHFMKPIPVREVSIVSYRHIFKNKTIEYLSQLIQEMTGVVLSTKNYKNKDLDIVGI